MYYHTSVERKFLTDTKIEYLNVIYYFMPRDNFLGNAHRFIKDLKVM